RLLTIHRSKTEAGERVIPLTHEALSVLSAIRKRALLFGGVEPEHYVFAAFKASGRYDRNRMCIHLFDPTRSVRTWKRAWHRLTEEAGLAGLRFHDLRHHAITELAESGASDQTIMSIAGHVSRKMLDRYSHIRVEAKRNALEALSNRMPEGYGTIHGTNGLPVPTFTDLSSTGA